MNNPETLFDTRLVERNVSRGKLTPEQLAEHLKSLPDAAGNAANLEQAVGDRGIPATPKAEAPKKGGKHG